MQNPRCFWTPRWRNLFPPLSDSPPFAYAVIKTSSALRALSVIYHTFERLEPPGAEKHAFLSFLSLLELKKLVFLRSEATNLRKLGTESADAYRSISISVVNVLLLFGDRFGVHDEEISHRTAS